MQTVDLQHDSSKRYSRYTNEKYNTLHEELLPSEKIWDFSTRDNFLIQVDYVLPIGDKQFEAGYRSDLSNSVTDYQVDDQTSPTSDYITNNDLSNIFDYTQNTHALYTQYGDRFGDLSVYRSEERRV